MFCFNVRPLDLYIFSDFFRRNQPTVQFEDLRSVAILAVKYKVDYVKEEAINRLSQVFPSSSMDEWDTHLMQDDDNPPIELTGRDAIAVVGLARLLGAHFLLPLAFYVCANQGDDLITGVQYDNDLVRLSEDDQLTCLAVRDEMLEGKNDVVGLLAEYLTDTPFDDCETPEACRGAIRKLNLKAVEDRCFMDPSAIDPMDDWIDRAYRKDKSRKPCADCDEHLRSTINSRREDVWNGLGHLVGVHTWPFDPADQDDKGKIRQ